MIHDVRIRIGFFFAFGLLIVLGSRPCRAVIIFEKGVAEPVRGFLVEADQVRVVVDVLLPNGETRQRIVPQDKIELLIQAVSRERLESLRSERPSEYRDYAEELAGKTNDPEAQLMAIRLYQIAAYLSPDKLGQSCLLGMVALARSPEEERKFRAAAFLLDKDHNRAVLREPSVERTGGMKLTAEQRQAVRALMRSLRDGRFNDARAAAKRPAVREPLQRISNMLTPADFAELRAGDGLPPALMLKVLAVELALDPPPGDSPTAPGLRVPSGWSQLNDPQRIKPFPTLTLESLTEFDPRECHFRNGKWAA